MDIKKTAKELKKLASADVFEIKKAAGDGVFIEGFANKFSVDRGDEIITTDAWELDNFKKNPIILFNHGLDTLGGTPVGKATEVRQTDEGLFIKVRMSNSQAPGIRMVRDLVEERILKAFSVGFDPKETDAAEIDGKSVRKITKAELFEVSIVGVPMNQDSVFELSEKALTTKSLHQIKTDFLKAKGAKKALEIEKKFVDGCDRKQIIEAVAEDLDLNITEVKDMLAGDKEIPDEVIKAFNKQMSDEEEMPADKEKPAVEDMPADEDKKSLAELLAAALASIEDGTGEEEVLAELMRQVAAEEASEEEMEDEDEMPAEEGSEEEGKAEGEEAPAPADAGEGSDEEEVSSEDSAKKDFQDCVNSKIPKLIDEGKDRDQAVAQAIAMCQESGKCALTPAGKMAAYDALFSAMEGIDDLTNLNVELPDSVTFAKAAKQIDEGAQKEDQVPTTPIDTDAKNDDFGSPFLDAAKQTNVLLGTLVSEIQSLRKEIASNKLPEKIDSEDSQPKDSENSTDSATEKSVGVDYAEKKLENLNQRLKNLGY